MLVIVNFRPGATFPSITLGTKPEPSDSLGEALTPISNAPKAELRFLAVQSVLPTFRFADKSAVATLHRLACEQVIFLVQTLQATAPVFSVYAALTDVFECTYRMRWVNEVGGQADRCVRALGVDVLRHLIIAWCYCLIHAVQPVDTPLARVYFSRLALHCGRTIVKAVAPVGIPANDLVPLLESYVADGPADGIEAVALRIAKAAQNAMDRGLIDNPACDLRNLRTLLNCSVVTLAAVVAGMYPIDIESFGARVVDYATAVVTSDKVDTAKKRLVRAQQIFLQNLLYFLDGLRYEEGFQYVFCTWPYGGFQDARAE
jgi:hypothetical protein